MLVHRMADPYIINEKNQKKIIKGNCHLLVWILLFCFVFLIEIGTSIEIYKRNLNNNIIQ